MNDPRMILCDNLQKAGIPRSVAFMIALEAGSSQEYVDKDYIKELNLSSESEEAVFQNVSRFYLGYFDEKDN